MAAAASATASPSFARKAGEWFVPLAAVGVVFVMVVPIPALLLDLLLAASLTLAVLVLLASLQILKPVEFSVFPP